MPTEKNAAFLPTQYSFKLDRQRVNISIFLVVVQQEKRVQYHSIGMCRIRRFLAILRSFFHSSLLYTLSVHPFPPASLPSSLTSSCHLYLGLPLSLVSKFIYNTFLGILFSSILCTCPNLCNLFNIIVSLIKTAN